MKEYDPLSQHATDAVCVVLGAWLIRDSESRIRVCLSSVARRTSAGAWRDRDEVRQGNFLPRQTASLKTGVSSIFYSSFVRKDVNQQPVFASEKQHWSKFCENELNYY